MRVLHCPTNIAGQMWEYVQGLRSFGVDATAMTFRKHPFGYPDDLCLNLHLESGIFRIAWKVFRNFLEVVRKYDVIHFHFGKTLLPYHIDLPILKLLGKKMVMNYWGSEVRLRSIARMNNPYYDMAEHIGDDAKKVKSIKKVARYIKVAIVADYELESYVAPFFGKVAIVPQALKVTQFETSFPRPEKSVPLLLHAPSRKSLKGTDLIEKVIAHLKRRYRFDFLLVNGVKNEELREILKRADIVIDQLLLGAYGIASIEAMASGKPVLCYIRDDLISKYPEDLPIVNANPDTIEEKIEMLLINPHMRRIIGEQSRRFVEKHHDSKVVAKRLIELYETL